MSLGARSFNGTTDKISLGDFSTPLGSNTPISAAIWLNIPASMNDGNFHSPFSCGDQRGGNGQDAFAFGVFNDGSFNVQVAELPSNPSAVTLSSGQYDSLHHWGITYNNTGKVTTGYYDGVNKGTNTAFTRGTNNLITKIGCGTNNGHTDAEFCALNLAAEAAIWTVVLTDAEMAALAKGIRAYMIRPASLFAYWPVDGIQSPEPDLSGNARNGTVTGTLPVSGPPLALFTPRWPLALDAGTTTNIYNTNYLHSIRRKFEPIGY